MVDGHSDALRNSAKTSLLTEGWHLTLMFLMVIVSIPPDVAFLFIGRTTGPALILVPNKVLILPAISSDHTQPIFQCCAQTSPLLYS